MEFNPLATWDKIADDWDEMMGSDGNDYWKIIELPVLERMVETKAGERALDLATGNGLVARWLRRGGANVTATDGSSAMLEAAKRRDGETSPGPDDGGSISYRVLNITDPRAFDDFANAELSTVDSLFLILGYPAISGLSFGQASVVNGYAGRPV